MCESAKKFRRRRVENTVGSTRENAELRECRHDKAKLYRYGLKCRRVFRANEVFDCAVLREMTLAARELLRHKVLDWKVDALRKREKIDREMLARKNGKLKEKPEAARERPARLEMVVQDNGKSENRKRGTADGESTSGSGRSPKSNCSPEVRSLTLKKKKGE